MTATDQAFIRLFDSQAGPREMAPHVSFATRGVQLASGFEPVIVWGGGPAVATTAHQAPSAASLPATDAAPRTNVQSAVTSNPPAPHFRQAPVAAKRASAPDTYLPSAYRNLVEVDDAPAVARARAAPGPHVAPAPPAASPGAQRSHSRPPRHPVAGTRQPASTDRALVAGAGPPPPADRSRHRPLEELLYESPLPQDFQPAFEVDRLRWPSIVVRMLQECCTQLESLGDALEQGIEDAENVTVFHSTHSHAGCTTLTLAVARLLAGRGRSIAIVDADFLQPHIARAVGLALAEGWETTLRSRVALSESVIRSVEDGLSIVPLAAPLSGEEICDDALAARALAAVRQLAAHHDLVLIDGGCPAASPGAGDALMRIFAAAADGCVLVAADELEGVDTSGFDRPDGPPVLGIVENCAAGP